MKSLPVHLRPNAVQDLEEIADYIARRAQSSRTALGFVQRIRSKCMKIGETPYGSPQRLDLGPGIRVAPFENSAVILYRVTDNTVEIVGVFYGGRDYESLWHNNGDI